MINITTLQSGSAGNCYFIQSDNCKKGLLIECGVKMSLIRRTIPELSSNVAGCIISHEHKDHSGYMTKLIESGVKCYTSQGTIEGSGCKPCSDLIPIKSETLLDIAGWKVLPFDVVHDAAEPLCFLISDNKDSKLLFVTDTFKLPKKYQFGAGITHLMIECNYSIKIINDHVYSKRLNKLLATRILNNHIGLEDVIEILKRLDISSVIEIHLLHLSDNNSDADLFKQTIQEKTGIPVFIA